MYNTHNVMSDPDDMILCENVESLMAKQQLPANMNPQQYLYVQEQTRQNFYQNAIPKVPRVVQYIFESDLDTDKKAAGLDIEKICPAACAGCMVNPMGFSLPLNKEDFRKIIEKHKK